MLVHNLATEREARANGADNGNQTPFFFEHFDPPKKRQGQKLARGTPTAHMQHLKRRTGAAIACFNLGPAPVGLDLRARHQLRNLNIGRHKIQRAGRARAAELLSSLFDPLYKLSPSSQCVPRPARRWRCRRTQQGETWWLLRGGVRGKKGWKGEDFAVIVRSSGGEQCWHRIFTYVFFKLASLDGNPCHVRPAARSRAPRSARSICCSVCRQHTSLCPLSLVSLREQHVDVQIDSVHCASGGDHPHRGRFRCVRRAVSELQDRCAREQHPSGQEQLPVDGRRRGHDSR